MDIDIDIDNLDNDFWSDFDINDILDYLEIEEDFSSEFDFYGGYYD